MIAAWLDLDLRQISSHSFLPASVLITEPLTPKGMAAAEMEALRTAEKEQGITPDPELAAFMR